MWDKLTTSKMDIAQEEFQKRMQKDTGLLKLGPANSSGKKAVTEARLLAIMPDLEKYYELWLAYPDKLVDLLSPEDTHFKLMPFQRLSLRVNARHKLIFQTATRGYSKSFIAVLTQMLMAALLPRSKSSIVSEYKGQTANIGREKINELKFLMPLLANEFDETRGSGKSQSKDFLRVVTKSKSELDVVSIGDSARGGRRHSIIMEEAKDLPAQQINAVVLPLLNISRRTVLGEINRNEPHQRQLYVGSAGTRHSFAYEKCMEILIITAIKPEKAFCWGGNFKLPVYYGLLDEEFVLDQKNSSTYSEGDFAREYESKWTSENEASLFSWDALNKLRTVKKAEWKAEDTKDTFYILSVDVARSGSAKSAFEIIKVHMGEEYFTKKVVNVITMQGAPFDFQALKIKELDAAFNFNRIIIDGNGLGVGLVDFLMTDTLDKKNQILYGPYNVDNIKDYPNYAQSQKVGAPPKIYVVKTNAANAGAYHTHCYKELMSGRVRLLVDAKVARQKLLSTVKGQQMAVVERDFYLRPYNNTTLLIDETANIKINRDTISLKIEMIDSNKEKDTFSALEYGLGYIDKIERDYYAKKRKKRAKWSSAMFYN